MEYFYIDTDFCEIVSQTHDLELVKKTINYFNEESIDGRVERVGRFSQPRFEQWLHAHRPKIIRMEDNRFMYLANKS